MSDKYLNIDLNDPRASAIADVMGNKTAKKILDLIAEKEVSESDIASELKLPLNTVGYNIDKLLKAELIEKSKNFFWSVKGKKIPTYKLSNRKILISPKRLTVAPIAIIASIIGIVLLIAFFAMNGNGPITKENNANPDISNGLKSFASYAELEEFLNNSNSNSMNNYYFRNSGGVVTALAEDAAAPTAASGSAKSSADSYSSTNIQVAGIDEPDFVKNDGKYIYMISGRNLYVVDAYPAENMKILSNVSLSDYANNLFINGDKLIVFMNSYEQYNYSDGELGYGDLGTPEAISSRKMAVDSIMPCAGYGCGGYSKPNTEVLIYDVSDKEHLVLDKQYSFDGNYMNARMAGNYVYVISQNYAYGVGRPIPMYKVDGVSKEVAIEDISYSTDYGENFVFTTIGAIDLDNSEVNTKVYLLGNLGTVYVSENSIYLIGQKWMDYDKQVELRIEAMTKLLPSEYDDKVKEILDNDSYMYEKESKISELVYGYSDSLGKEASSDFNKKLQEALDESYAKLAKLYEKTIIHKIDFDRTDIEYVNSGEVPGYLLNQYSLDEFEGNLRVAVTTGNFGSASLNHLYILDKKLDIIGSVEDLASGERIYSTRFIGNRVYMVTFKQVDPLFVIDLSNPSAPNVLGYLKVTGYSSYLHPYDENHIIGIGMESDENGVVSGVKIALFDVSDVANPKENAKYEIKSEGKWSWTSSEALYEPKAFLFDKEKNLLVVPIQYSYYVNDRYQSWNGAYVFYIDSESIELDKKITHIEEYVPKYSAASQAPKGEERVDGNGNTWTKVREDVWRSDKYSANASSNGEERYYLAIYNPALYEQNNEYIDYIEGGVNYSPYDYEWNRRIQRSLYMDNVLYTVSLGMIKANSLDSFDEINTVELDYQEQQYPIGVLY